MILPRITRYKIPLKELRTKLKHSHIFLVKFIKFNFQLFFFSIKKKQILFSYSIKQILNKPKELYFLRYLLMFLYSAALPRYSYL